MKTALKISLALTPWAVSTSLLAAGLPVLRVDDSKKASESGYLYRVVDGRVQAVTLPQVEIDLNEFSNCDGQREKKCVVFSMANRDALSPLSTEVDRFQVQVQNTGNGDFRFACGPVAMNPVPLYNAPNFVKCEFQANGMTKINSARDFRDHFDQIREVLPVRFEVTFKATGKKKVILPPNVGTISIDLGRVETFLKGAAGSLATQRDGETFIPWAVGVGLVQTAVGYNPCWVGQSDDAWKTGATYQKGITEGKNYNTLLFDSREEQQSICNNFRENPASQGTYRDFLMTIYDRVFNSILEDRHDAGFAITSGYGRTLSLDLTLSPGAETWQDENRLVATDVTALGAYAFADLQ